MTAEPSLKPVTWVGSSRKDLREFPEAVQDHVGYALYVAQRGGKHRDTKALSGLAEQGLWKSSLTTAATHSARCTPCNMQERFMSFTPSRRNRRRDGKHRAGTWS